MNELEAMLGKPDWKPSENKWEMPKSTTTPPDALVLINVVITCNCGEDFLIPNRRVMFRFDKSLLKIEKGVWKPEYNSLPREEMDVDEEVSACMTCFHTTSFTSTDFE